ncbi:MAG: D-alanyl-D-alanine carboxypeptidase [Thiolinea sp.]
MLSAFRTIWEDLGGTLGGGMRVGTVSKEDQRFHVHTSRELGEQIRLINKWSNNVMTRQLLLTLGARQYGGPATLKGRMAILDVLREQGVSTDGLVIDNGSGFIADARISPNQLGQLLQQVWRDLYAGAELVAAAGRGRHFVPALPEQRSQGAQPPETRYPEPGDGHLRVIC